MAQHLTEEEQIEALKRWWKENWLSIVLPIVVAVVGYAAVDDVGTIVHETVVDGQTHGGIAQGLGQLHPAADEDRLRTRLHG